MKPSGLRFVREPVPPSTQAKTLDAVLAGGDDGDEDTLDVELMSLAPPPHIDIVVQKQEHRLERIER
jgi:hypothetical protein